MCDYCRARRQRSEKRYIVDEDCWQENSGGKIERTGGDTVRRSEKMKPQAYISCRSCISTLNQEEQQRGGLATSCLSILSHLVRHVSRHSSVPCHVNMDEVGGSLM